MTLKEIRINSIATTKSVRKHAAINGNEINEPMIRLTRIIKIAQMTFGGKKNPDYWKKYRQNNPSYTSKNRELQKIRNQKRQKSPTFLQSSTTGTVIAKMDALLPEPVLISGTYECIILSENNCKEERVILQITNKQTVTESCNDCKESTL